MFVGQLGAPAAQDLSSCAKQTAAELGRVELALMKAFVT